MEETEKEIMNAIEAILFVSGKKISFEELKKFFNINNDILTKILNTLKEKKENDGVVIKIYDDFSIQAVTNSKYGEAVLKYFNPEAKPKKLTKAAFETIAIIAYNQPITKSEIERIRGVNVEKVLTTLEEKNFIKIVGKKNTIGTPNLYSVTEEFLNYLGIKNVEELPNYDEVKNLAKLDKD